MKWPIVLECDCKRRLTLDHDPLSHSVRCECGATHHVTAKLVGVDASQVAPSPPYGSLARITEQLQEEVEALVPAFVPLERVRAGIIVSDGSMTTADGTRWVCASVLDQLREADPAWLAAVMGQVKP